MQRNGIDQDFASVDPERRPVEPPVRRLNQLARALNAQTYLEIGVNKGMTLFAVDVPNKVAVDPFFRFDVSRAAEIHPNTSFKEMTSDVFFSTLPHHVKYDLIFIDGLHTFEQTYRDICNALLHAHDQTVFLIDDVKPNDVFSSLRDEKITRKRRSETGNMNASWHGDVFKVIFALHDFHPGLNYRTISGSGNPQTVLWQSNRGWREPLFNSLEAISRLNYFDLLDNIAILRECPEGESIEICVSELSDLSLLE